MNGLLTTAAVAAALLVGGAAGAAARRPRRWSAADAARPWFPYRVRPDDTLSGLARTFLGDAAAWPVLAEAMPVKPRDPQRALLVGSEVRVPCVWTVAARGDTLSKVAGRLLDDPARWRRVWEANREQVPEPDHLEAGQRLAVPRLPAASARPAAPELPGATQVGLLPGDLEEMG